MVDKAKTSAAIRKELARGRAPVPIMDDMIIPNLSGDHSAGRLKTTPTKDIDLVNKKYVDDNSGGSGDVTKVGTPVNNQVGIWTGDGTIEGDTKVTFDGTAFNVNGNITTTGTVDTIDVAGMSGFVVSNSAHRDDETGADHADIVTAVGLNTAKDTNVTTNITVVEAPTNVEIQSSDGSNDTIAAADVTNAGVMTTTMYDEHVVNTAHALDNTQAHTDYLLNNANDTTTGVITMSGGIITGDAASADTAYVPMVLYNTDDTPPAASGFPVGTLYVQYTA